MKNIILVLLIIITSFGCKNNNDQLIEVKDENNLVIPNAKDKLIEEIFYYYNLIPPKLFPIKGTDTINYSIYEEFINLKSSINNYKQFSLNEEEEQLLGIVICKSYISISDFDNAIIAIDTLNFSSNFENYKNLLRGIIFKYDEKTSDEKENLFFKDLLNNVVTSKPIECDKYFLISVLANKNKIDYCKDQNSLFENLKKMQHEDIVRNYILSEIVL